MAIISFNKEGVLVACNLACARLFGLETKDELLEKFGALLPDDSRTTLATEIQNAFASGNAQFTLAANHITGQEIMLEITLARDPENKLQPTATGHAIDITKYTTAHAAVVETELVNKTLLESAPYAISIWYEQHKLFQCNRQTLELHGLTSQEEFVARFPETVPATQPCGTSSWELGPKYFNQAITEGYANFEYMCRNVSTGELIPTEKTMVRIKLKNETLVASFTSDLRTIKGAMQRENEATLRWKAVLDTMPVGVNMFSENNEMLDVNTTMLNQFGCASREEYFSKWRETIPEYQPDGKLSSELFEKIVGQSFSQGYSDVYEWMMQTIHGEPIPMNISSVVVKEGEKSVLVTYTQDMRPIHEMIAKIREADERASILMNALPVASALMDENFNIADCNRTAINLLARTSNEPFTYTQSEDGIVYHCENNCETCEFYQTHECTARRCLLVNWQHIIPGYLQDKLAGDAAVKTVCELAIETGKHIENSTRQTLGGEEFIAELTLVPVKYNGGQGLALYMRDMRETKLREIAEEESRAKTRFLARMSHEIRTPMNAVLGITEIELQKGRHSAETEDALLRIHSSSNMLLGIINDILDLSKVEAGKMEIVPQSYEFASMIVDTVQLNLMHIGTKQIDFKLEISPEIPKFMVGDELRIKQVLNNLLSNAFKYTAEGEVSLKIGCEAHENNETILLFEIKDTGQGMSKSRLHSLFEIEFNRLNIEANRDIQGSGLGLTITYSLISLMGGHIGVESSPGKGSMFTVRIPQKIDGSQTLGKAAAADLQNLESVKNSLRKITRVERELMPYGSVLIVDDVESNLYVAKGLLMPYKLAIETVTGGDQAIELVKQGNVYDIIFMDHMMPGIDGMEATRIIRESGYTAPIVALTANILAGHAEMFMNGGFNDFISKPVDASRLDECLKIFIRDRRETEVFRHSAEVLSSALVSSFLRDAQKVDTVLRSIIETGEFSDENIKLYTINTHAIKAALANIGESALSDTAYILELASMENDTATISAKTLPFLEELAEIMGKLTPRHESDTYDEDPELLRNQLAIIAEACDAMNKKAARKALRVLDEKAWSAKTRASLSSIAEKLLHSKFDEAGEEAREINLYEF